MMKYSIKAKSLSFASFELAFLLLSFLMDPLSVTANIITVLQTANSIIAVCFEFRAALKQIPWSLTRVIDEIKDLRHVLESMEQASSTMSGSCKPPTQQFNALQLLCEPNTGPLARCNQELAHLEAKITNDKQFSRKRAFMQVMVWQLKEPEAKRCLQRIDRCKSTFQLALTADELVLMADIRDMTVSLNNTIVNMNANVSDLLMRIESRDLDQYDKAITEWLSPATTWDNHDFALSAHKKDTGNWFIQSKIFHDWCVAKTSCLWISGFPGSGKTVLFSTIVNSLQESGRNFDCCSAFFYCDFRKPQSQSTINILGSLTAQLCSSMEVFPPELGEAFNSSRSRNAPTKRPSYALLRNVLTLLTRHKKILLLVDAVDECDDRKDLLAFMVSLQKANLNIGILLTGRNDVDIADHLNTFSPCRLEDWTKEIDKDIQLLIDHRLESDTQLQRLKDPVKNEIKQALSAKSDGMFRLVQCTLDSVSALRTVRSIRLALKDVPQGLGQMYEAILRKVPAADINPVRRVLLWLSFSVLPLTLEELHSAIAIEHGLDSIDEDDCLASSEDILWMCGTLLDVTDDCHVRLAHLSVKDYLLSTEIRQGPVSAFALQADAGNREMALDCFTYLMFRNFQSGPCLTSEAFTSRVASYPFLRHASIAWTYYLRKTDSSTQLDGKILAFFSDDKRPAFMSWVQVLNADSNFKWDIYPRHATSLYYAASFGLDHVVQYIMNNGTAIDAPGSRFGGTALHAAVLRDHAQVVETLLSAGASPNQADFNFVTPLHTAVSRGYVECVKLLLRFNAKVDARDRGGETPADWAVKAGQTTCLELLRGGLKQCQVRSTATDNGVWQRSKPYLPDWYECRSGLESSIVINVSIGGIDIVEKL